MSKQEISIVLVGDQRVGKTSLVNNFLEKNSTERYQATLTAELNTKQIVVDGVSVTLQVWDTPGQQIYQHKNVLYKNVYKYADGCILVYDITRLESFENLEPLMDEFLLTRDTRFPFIVLGNKLDKERERKVSESEVKKWCNERNNIPLIETFQADFMVEIAFQNITRSVLTGDSGPYSGFWGIEDAELLKKKKQVPEQKIEEAPQDIKAEDVLGAEDVTFEMNDVLGAEEGEPDIDEIEAEIKVKRVQLSELDNQIEQKRSELMELLEANDATPLEEQLKEPIYWQYEQGGWHNFQLDRQNELEDQFEKSESYHYREKIRRGQVAIIERYRVDFQTMVLTHLGSNTVKKIRRLDLNADQPTGRHLTVSGISSLNAPLAQSLESGSVMEKQPFLHSASLDDDKETEVCQECKSYCLVM